MTQYWPNSLSLQWSRQAVITVSHHDLVDHKNKYGVANDLFCTGVIGHPRHVFKLETEISSKKNDITGLRNDLKILGPGVQLRVRKD